MTPTQFLTRSAKSAAHAVRFRRDRTRRIKTGQHTRGDMLHMLDWASWRTAIPHVPTRVAIATAIRDCPAERLDVIIAWLHEEKDFDLLAHALLANTSNDELRAHINGSQPLDRDTVRFIAAFNPKAVDL